ncbi:MAG: decaprenyl-phosphate phosphoribosyltransferase [Deltaproteobacteria bacterium]|nr:MAG: decaprenyl-phosphate phosphoribosyltransferase [Deltaproteobacteria bacterium]
MAGARGFRDLLNAVVRAARPKQWAKNVLIFAPLVFSLAFLDSSSLLSALLAAASFSLLASSGYLLNDILDRKADARHPKKRHRPIASGALPVGLAIVEMVGLLAAGLTLGFFVSPAFLVIGLAYLVLTVSYSFWLKHRVILDVMILSVFYLLRVVAGAVAIEVRVSEWLLLCTVFLALFLGFHKRRAELVRMGDGDSRRTLDFYSLPMLDQFQAITTGAVVLCYALYAAQGSPTPWMTLTIPFVLYGIFRYIWLVDQRGEGGAPDETLLKDGPILMAGLGFALTAAIVLLSHDAGLLPEAFQDPLPGRLPPMPTFDSDGLELPFSP